MGRTILAAALAAAFLTAPSVGQAAAPGTTSSSPGTTTHKPSTKKSTVKNPSSKKKDVHVRGYYRKNGTYVAPHTRSAPK